MKIISVKVERNEIIPNVPGHSALVTAGKHKGLVIKEDERGLGVNIIYREEMTLVPWTS